MAKVFSHGQTAKDMKDHTLVTKNKDLDVSIGQMDVFTKGSGLKASSMEKESTHIKMAKQEKVYGKMEKDLTGSKMK